MSRQACPICDAPLPERLNDPAEPQACEHADGEWWERASWICAACGIPLNIRGMYEYGGICPNCRLKMKLVVIKENVPF